MLVVSPRPAVRSDLVGVLHEAGFGAEAFADPAQAAARLAETDVLMVVVDARPMAGAVSWDPIALPDLARRAPALLVVADAQQRGALEEALAPCRRSLLLFRLEPVSVLVGAEMLVDDRVPVGLWSAGAPSGRCDASAGDEAAPYPLVEARRSP